MVAHTTETLLLGNLETLKLSEIPWQARGGSGTGTAAESTGGDAPTEKFIFETPSAALLFYAGELSIVEYGRNKVKHLEITEKATICRQTQCWFSL